MDLRSLDSGERWKEVQNYMEAWMAKGTFGYNPFTDMHYVYSLTKDGKETMKGIILELVINGKNYQRKQVLLICWFLFAHLPVDNSLFFRLMLLVQWPLQSLFTMKKNFLNGNILWNVSNFFWTYQINISVRCFSIQFRASFTKWGAVMHSDIFSKCSSFIH